MTTLYVNLPDTLKEFVETQVASGGYGSANDYILTLLREAQKRQAWDRVEALVVEGLNSGEPFAATKQHWEEKRQRLEERYPEAKEP